MNASLENTYGYRPLLSLIAICGIMAEGLVCDAALYSPVGYLMSWEDAFDTFDTQNWSEGLVYDGDPDNVHLIWSPSSGGPSLLNDNYRGYITDEDSYIETAGSNTYLTLRNQKRNYSNTDASRPPLGDYEYTSGWVNSMRKRYFNGTERGTYMELRAQFPSGPASWPAIWLVTESWGWPPEVDVWEYFGTFFHPDWGSDQMYLRFIYGPNYQDTSSRIRKLNNFDLNYDSESWHTYGYLWTDSMMV